MSDAPVSEPLSARQVPPMSRWDDRACRGVDTEVFYVGGPRSDTRLAQEICAVCPIRRECLLWAMETRQQFGVWGGTTPNQRTRLRARHRGR